LVRETGQTRIFVSCQSLKTNILYNAKYYTTFSQSPRPTIQPACFVPSSPTIGGGVATPSGTGARSPSGRSPSVSTTRKHREEKHIGIMLLTLSTAFIICQSLKVKKFAWEAVMLEIGDLRKLEGRGQTSKGRFKLNVLYQIPNR
jgi:hypothetical protein